ncbi:hypothetical protein [Mycoplasma nasistruthionis]|uniref:Uncharacterized protein n=1 Tax=Mycoplasma nasistruthionis TaxID=353852 RepID=A0A4Y6I6K0_9MOLU|nr:hypothetical protein [Mycoplasma nasistruthionis]QDF65236.1 hypothetical protein FIV53_03030 [Mycoplasma nasistruthionis]
MGTLVKARCNDCQASYNYVFGVPNDLRPFRVFLMLFIRSQKNLFVWDNFVSVMNSELELDINFQLKSDQEKNEILNQNFKSVQAFFSDEEKKALTTNILMKAELNSYPVFKVNDDPKYRQIFNVPLLRFDFIDGSSYQRKYGKHVYYVQVSEDQRYLTCPRCNRLSAGYLSETEV